MGTVFVSRDSGGKISGVYANCQPDLAEQKMSDDDAEVRAYLGCDGWSAYQLAAQIELDKSDLVAIRCMKAGVAYPIAWRDRDTALRAVVRASAGDATAPLPNPPSYPAGT